MPKKSSGAAGPKKGPPAANDEGSYIVFGDDKSDRKKKDITNSGSGPGVKADEGEGSQDAAKKPDTRQLIGGASWTGKLPVNLLSEHCQKQKWAKPEYTMVGCCLMV